ncbi:S-layer homology domain-containing protein [Candidatus Gracilibacteria bacterium]|nr:S-layer homology domain-containing protein [Candidatus Gracilibacteria bacterium]
MPTKKLLSLLVILSLTPINLPIKTVEAATINQSCAANPTLTLGVDFNTNDDLNLNGGGTCTITIDQDEAGADSTISLNSLTITGNTTLTHAVAGTTANHHNEIDFVVTGDVSIESGSSITVTGKGYLGAFAGANSSQYGRTNGNTVTGGSFFRIGGAHGGRPGKTGAFQIAESYDSIINPALPGGGGGAADSGFTGGTGGGIVRITATNIAVSGNIIADGGNGSQTGGAGGTVYLNASGTISGSGSITANGGGATGTSYSGGGGGRIALLYGSLTHDGTISAYGYQSDGALEDGAAGTIFKKATTDSNGYLTIDNNSYPDVNFSTEIDSTNDTTFDSVTLQNYARLFIKSSATSFSTTMLRINSNSTFETDANQTFTSIDTTSLYLNGGTAQFDGDLNLTSFDTTTGDETGTLVTNGTTYISSGNVTVGQNLTWEANGDIKTSSETNLTSLTIKGTDSGGQIGGILTHSRATTSTTYDLNFTVGTLTVESGTVSDGTINVNGKGYLGGYGSASYYVAGVYTTDTNSSQYGRTNGNTITGGSHFRISGSHGGQSGKTGTYTIAAAYDSIVSPSLPGGGGGGPDSGSAGGNGGGIVNISATNAVIQGDILANGSSGNSTGGAGGTIKLTITETISGSGSITANGVIPTTNIYTGGGGGRISLTYGTYTHSGTLLAAGGDSDGADEDGAAGTVYKKPSSATYGDLIINNNSNNASYYATSLLTTIPAADQLYNSGYAFNSVSVSNYGVLNIPAAVDSSASADNGVTENFHSNSCTTDDNDASNGEITYANATVSGSTASDYTCFGLNQAPSISTTMTATQQTNDGFVNITYSLTDADIEADISLTAYEYSLDNAVWSTMTIADDEAHSGIINLSGDSDGTDNTFVWDTCADIGNNYDTSVYVRFTPNDGTTAGATSTINTPFAVDCAIPIITNVTASQTSGSRNIAITYDLADDSGTDLLVAFDISEDSGATWNVTDTTVSGHIGAEQTTSTGKSITWNAGTDFDNQDQSDIRIRLRATDKFQNAGANTSSDDFALDTQDPAILADFSATASGTNGTLSWTSATDTNFNHYEIWYGTDSDEVTTRTATEWDNTDDNNLLTSTTNSTTITGLTPGLTYYFKIWAIDDFTNETTTASASAATNSAPSISTTMTVSQQTDDSFINIQYELTDTDVETDISLTTYEYSLDNTTWSTMTIADDQAHSGIINLSGNSDGTTNTFVWNACTDIPTTDDTTVYVRFVANDGTAASATSTINTPFAIDCATPTNLASLTISNIDTTTATLSWTPATDTNFNHYEIWYNINLDNITNRTATEWDNTDDNNLLTSTTNTTTITGLTPGLTYYFKIWAIDDFGNEQTSTAINAATTNLTGGGGSTSSRRSSSTTENSTPSQSPSPETSPPTPSTPSTPSSTTITPIIINTLKERKIINGYPDGSLQTEKPINRAELLKIVVTGAGYNPDPVENNNCFTDVQGQWFAPYVCFAKAKGWIKGYENGNFGPSDVSTEAQTAIIFSNTLNYTPPIKTTPEKQTTRGEAMQTIYSIISKP